MAKNIPKRQSRGLATSGSPRKTLIPSIPLNFLAKPHKFDIIVYEYVELQSKEDIETVAKEIMGRAMESAECGTVGERTTYGNQAGRDLLENMKETMKRLERLEDQMVEKDTQIANHQAQIANHQARIAESRAQITSLQNRVHSLTEDAEGYYDIRHRFIDIYRRDVRKDATDEIRARIKKNNKRAHEGDVVVDVQLYTTGRRFDEFALADLYGLDSIQISLLTGVHGYSSIINTLNAGATWRNKGPASIPTDVAVAFQAFAAGIRANPSQGLTDDTINRAYCAFWVAHDKYH